MKENSSETYVEIVARYGPIQVYRWALISAFFKAKTNEWFRHVNDVFGDKDENSGQDI